MVVVLMVTAAAITIVYLTQMQCLLSRRMVVALMAIAAAITTVLQQAAVHVMLCIKAEVVQMVGAPVTITVYKTNYSTGFCYA